MTVIDQIIGHLLEDGVMPALDAGDAFFEAEEDFDSEVWKEITPDVPAAGVQRWVFTEYELHNPKSCRSNDEFFAVVEGCDLEVIVWRTGGVTGRWGDGTAGVPADVEAAAEEAEEYVKPSWRRQDERYDVEADSWYDVYVDKYGAFMAFADLPKFLCKTK